MERAMLKNILICRYKAIIVKYLDLFAQGIQNESGDVYCHNGKLKTSITSPFYCQYGSILPRYATTAKLHD